MNNDSALIGKLFLIAHLALETYPAIGLSRAVFGEDQLELRN